MTKTHFAPDGVGSEVCGRTASSPLRRESVTSRVTCLACKSQPKFKAAQATQRAEQQAAFEAQEPKAASTLFGEAMTCPCGNTLFREKPRSLFSFHFVCSACGHSLHPMTETGMCT